LKNLYIKLKSASERLKVSLNIYSVLLAPQKEKLNKI